MSDTRQLAHRMLAANPGSQCGGPPLPGMVTDEQLGNFARRVIQDAYSDASAAYWRRRARALEAAMPRPGDYTGQATPEDIEAQRWRLAAATLACAQRAELSVMGGRIV